MTASPKCTFHVVWTLTAEEDLAGIVDFIADENIEAAFAVLERIRDRAAALHDLPDRGRIVPELHQNGIILYRELIIAPWRIIYRLDGDNLFVMAVFDGRRNLEDLLLERFSR